MSLKPPFFPQLITGFEDEQNNGHNNEERQMTGDKIERAKHNCTVVNENVVKIGRITIKLKHTKSIKSIYFEGSGFISF